MFVSICARRLISVGIGVVAPFPKIPLTPKWLLCSPTLDSAKCACYIAAGNWFDQWTSIYHASWGAKRPSRSLPLRWIGTTLRNPVVLAGRC
jgi:hypothetical protein